jgi:hypothetical protein
MTLKNHTAWYPAIKKSLPWNHYFSYIPNKESKKLRFLWPLLCSSIISAQKKFATNLRMVWTEFRKLLIPPVPAAKIYGLLSQGRGYFNANLYQFMYECMHASRDFFGGSAEKPKRFCSWNSMHIRRKGELELPVYKVGI